jgi:hypothetical protein
MGAGQAGALGGLKPPDWKPQTKSDGSGVSTAGQF